MSTVNSPADLTFRLPSQRIVHAASSPSHPVPSFAAQQIDREPLLTAQDVAHRLSVSVDWVWDHSSRRKPQLPVIRMGDGILRYKASQIDEFIQERERLSMIRRASR